MKSPISASRISVARQAGFSLIELLIVLVIALVMSLAVFGVMSSFEANKRTMTTTNDIDQAGNYAIYQLDKTIRQAGSGYGALSQTAFGCELYSSLTNSNGSPGVILPFPSTTSMAAPFASLNTTLGGVYTLAPIVIAYKATTGVTDSTATAKPSDALIVMSGTSGYGEFSTLISTTTVPTATTLPLANYVAFNPYDLALIVNDTGVNGPSPCMIEEVASTFVQSTATSLPLGGAYTANPIGTQNLTTMSINAVSAVANLGNANPSNNNLPSFQILGVGGVTTSGTATQNNVLYSYDLLQGGTSGATFNTSNALYDSVFEMHALYYVVNTSGSSWVLPTSPYDVASLENGTTQALYALASIKAIRLGLIMRTNVAEKTAVTTAPLTLFSDLGSALTYTRTLTSGEQNYRYRTIEATIPLRNSLMLSSQ